MPVTKQWPSGTVNATPTSYQLPLNNELNWLQLSSFLQSLADSAQGTTFQKMRVRTVTATPDTVNATVDCILPINVASAAAINLPAGLEKQVFFIFDASGAAATNNITITPNGAETVRGAASLVLNKNYQGVILAFTGTDWKAFGPFITPGSVTDADFSGVLTTAKGGTGQNSTATFPGSGVVATVPAAGVVKSNGTVLSSSNVDLTSEVTGTLPNGNTTATSANTASAIVARDGSGNFSAGTITASLSGNATTATSATTAGNVSGVVAIANGGSGQTTANAALNAFLPNQATNAGKVLQTDGTNTSWASVLANGSTLLAADGLVGTPGIAFNADQDTGFYRIGANNLGFAANGVKVGEFGTTGWTLGDTALAASTFKVDSGGNTTFIISAPTGSTSALQFNINNTRQNSIEVTNTADFNFRNSASNVTLSIANNGTCTLGISGSNLAHLVYGSSLKVSKNQAGNAGTLVATGDNGSSDGGSALTLQYNDTTKWSIYQRNQTGGIVATAHSLVFSTGDLDNSLAKMVLSPSGTLIAGTSTTTTSPHQLNTNTNGDYVALVRNYNSTQPLGLQVIYPNMAPNDTGKEFIVCQDSTLVRLTVRSNGGIANYQANDVNLSDERLKTNITPTSSKLGFICSLQVKDFEYKDAPGKVNTGLIAQEVEALDPSLVQETGDIQTVDGVDFRPKAVRTTEIYHMMVKAIQELKQELDEAKAGWCKK